MSVLSASPLAGLAPSRRLSPATSSGRGRTAPAAPARKGRCTIAPIAAAGGLDAGQGAPGADMTRRNALALAAGALALGGVSPMEALAFTPPPQGFRRWYDKLDGYEFLYPSDWIRVGQTAADVFWRNPGNLEENVFMDVSSMSSSKYGSIRDFAATPEAAGEKVMAQFVNEFMSTRIGVQRVPDLISATEREAADGSVYYEVDVRVRSYANENQFGITPEERVPVLEFDRRIVSVFGVSNKRLYELRMQAQNTNFDQNREVLDQIGNSLRLFIPETAVQVPVS